MIFTFKLLWFCLQVFFPGREIWKKNFKPELKPTLLIKIHASLLNRVIFQCVYISIFSRFLYLYRLYRFLNHTMQNSWMVKLSCMVSTSYYDFPTYSPIFSFIKHLLDCRVSMKVGVSTHNLFADLVFFLTHKHWVRLLLTD